MSRNVLLLAAVASLTSSAGVTSALGVVAPETRPVRSTVTAPASSYRPIRFRRAPVVVVQGPLGGRQFDLYVRLTRPLPRARFGVLAYATVDNAGSGGPMGTDDKRHHCYFEGINDTTGFSIKLRQAQPGTRVTVRLQISGKHPQLLTRRVAVVAQKHGAPGLDLDVMKRLGCRRS